MYQDADQKLTEILALVAKCPEKLQDKGFELLLTAYLDSKKVQFSPVIPATGGVPPAYVAPAPAPPADPALLPDALKSRFTSQAGRKGVPVGRLAALFDFNVDPYNYHAFTIPGASKADRIRNAGLLLCAKTFLVDLGQWTADWKEFRAVCLDQQCWDKANVGTHLKKDAWFKTMSAADGLVLTSAGIEAAQDLLSQLAGGGEDSGIK
ncbi:MAG: hypothetical protein Q7T13_05275 [Polaromonas sp.]|nr:hypothetical protein [Polaromonas sp.]